MCNLSKEIGILPLSSILGRARKALSFRLFYGVFHNLWTSFFCINRWFGISHCVLLCYIISLFMSNWRINNPTLGILTFLRTILECHFKERFWRKWKFLEFLGLTVTETKISCVIKKHTYYHIHHMSSNFLMIEKNNFAWSF